MGSFMSIATTISAVLANLDAVLRMLTMIGIGKLGQIDGLAYGDIFNFKLEGV